MPEKNPPTLGASSAFEIITPSKSKKTSPKSIIIILLVFVFLAGAIFLGVILVKQNQDVRERAAASKCPAAEACPASGQPTLLRNCTPSESDNSPAESLCNQDKRVESCGGVEYCCPSSGAAWTTNTALCAVLSPSPSPTSTATASPTAAPTETIEPLVVQSPTPSPTSTATATASPTASATATATTTANATAKAASTPVPIPATGTGWPTYLGAGVGIIVIIASILLAL